MEWPQAWPPASWTISEDDDVEALAVVSVLLFVVEIVNLAWASSSSWWWRLSSSCSWWAAS